MSLPVLVTEECPAANGADEWSLVGMGPNMDPEIISICKLRKANTAPEGPFPWFNRSIRTIAMLYMLASLNVG